MEDKKKKEDELLNHNYDGIEEYDNDLPKWWKNLFLLTVIFGVVYVGYYELGPGLSQEETLVLDLEKIEKDKKLKEEKEALEPKSETVDLALIAADHEKIEEGKEVFVGKCASCHGPNGGGLIGPNLADSYWIHGGKLENIKMTIENGVLDKGMLAWKGVLKEEEILAVVAYVHSINGTTPTNPKPPQGDLYKE